MPIDPDTLDNLVTQADPALGDAALATLICADLRTARPIPTATVRPWMAATGILGRVKRTAASNALAAALTASGAPMPATLDKLNGAIAHLDDVGASFDSDRPDTADLTVATDTYRLLSLMVAINAQDATLGMTPAEMTTFLAFGGGLLAGPGSVTTADVTASRARVADHDARGKVVTALATVLNDWLGQQAVAPSKAAVLTQAGAALDQAGVV